MADEQEKKITTAELKESFYKINNWHSIITCIVIGVIFALFYFFAG